MEVRKLEKEGILYRDRDWLYEQLVVEDKTQTQVSKELGCSVPVINKWAGRHGLHSTNTDKNSPHRDKSFLYEELINKKKTYKQVADEIGVSYTAVRNWTIKFGLDKQKDTMLIEYTELIKEWDHEKNSEYDINKITFGSGEKVWWICSECEHEFSMTVVKRTRREQGCPDCGGQVVNDSNRLSTKRQDIAKQWDYDKNDPMLTPDKIMWKSNINVWWKCEICDYSWETTPGHRTRRNYSDCPNCNGKVLNEHNNLASVNPQLAKEWCYEKNKLKPKDVFPNTHQKFWWNCLRGHDPYEAAVYSRHAGRGCKRCSSSTRSSYPEQAIYKYMKKVFGDSKNLHSLSAGKSSLEVDVFIPKLTLVIEYDGQYYHKDKVKKDTEKSLLLKKSGFEVIRVREEGLPPIKGAVNIHIETPVEKNLNKMIRDIFETVKSMSPQLLSNTQVKNMKSINIDHEKYRKELESMITSKYDKFLPESNPELLKEWSDKNVIEVNKVKPLSKTKVWWQCEKYSHHQWKAQVRSRVQNSTGCPFCSGNRFSRENSLGVHYPESFEEWHPTKNGVLTPYDVSRGTGKKYWFIVNGEERYAKVTQRTAYYKYRKNKKDKKGK